MLQWKGDLNILWAFTNVIYMPVHVHKLLNPTHPPLQKKAHQLCRLIHSHLSPYQQICYHAHSGKTGYEHFSPTTVQLNIYHYHCPLCLAAATKGLPDNEVSPYHWSKHEFSHPVFCNVYYQMRISVSVGDYYLMRCLWSLYLNSNIERIHRSE